MHKIYFDYPNNTQTSMQILNSKISGWILSTNIIHYIIIKQNKRIIKLKTYSRLDLKYKYRLYKYKYGFSTKYSIFDIYIKLGYLPSEIIISSNNKNYTVQINYPDQYKILLFIKNLIRRKSEKFVKLEKIICCPICLGTLDKEMTCNKCKVSYKKSYRIINLLPEKYKKIFKIIDTENISSMGYDSKILNIINNKKKLYLDIGAGFKKDYYDNVVNLEIVPYSSTDVLAVGEKLPFKDNSFDGVFSIAVLEHVKDPFLCAKEMERVLKPGGVIICAVPFLQPLHAYPHHYYNMTQEGIKNLFTKIEMEYTEVPESSHPILSLNWILQLYTDGLNHRDKKDFLNTTVEQLLGITTTNMNNYDWVKNLSEDTKPIIAGGSYILGHKKKT